MQLNITAGCMSRPTATAASDTLLNGLIFVTDYFTYIGKPELLERIRMSQMSDKLVESFLCEADGKNAGENFENWRHGTSAL